MNQHPAYLGQYPLPQQQQFQYGANQPQPYQFHPQAVVQAQQMFNRPFQPTPVNAQQFIPQAPQSRPQSGHRQQQHQQKTHTRQQRQPSPAVDPGAPGPEPDSPEGDEDDVDQTQAGGYDTQPIFNLPPPPEDTYPTEPELEAAIHAWSLQHGYELVRRASKKNAKGVLYKRYYHCSKHGQRLNTSKLPPGAPRQRVNRKSARTGCPMSIACVSVDPNNPEGEWQVRHRKTHHNHAPLEAIALAGHRRRARIGGVEQAVDGLFSIGSSTAQVLQFLQKTHPDGLYTRTDVANMKLKWKKWGTCADRQSRMRYGRDTLARRGRSTTCNPCRENKLSCDGGNPVCGSCVQHGTQCVYGLNDLDPGDDVMLIDEDISAQIDPGPDVTSQSTSQPPPETTMPQQNSSQQQLDPRFQSGAVSQRQATEQILANLQTFRQEHVTPNRLTLQSSSVEILGQSSCGSGESFRSVPILFDTNDWPNFRDAMIAAAMKENTYEVLLGEKTEPEPITNSAECPVEEWNEHIRQQAIFNRRNAVQMSAIWEHLAPSFRNRVQNTKKAADAWAKLEESCQPRGSEQAYRLYLDLHSTTLESSGNNLHNYISHINATYEQFRLLKLNTSPPAMNRRQDLLPTARKGSDAVPEEMVCFLFLRGLGLGWATWVNGLVLTNNIGGFGTGERLGLKELGKRALGYQAQQRVGQGDGGR